MGFTLGLTSRRSHVESTCRMLHGQLLSDSTVERGEELKGLGLKTYDALHVACAEQASVEVLLTTDDRLVRAAARNAHELKVPVKNPLTWLQEVL